MDTNALVAELVKVAIGTLVTSRVSKAIGQKDIAEIISASGLCIIGVDLAKLIIPVIDSVSGFFKGLHDSFSGIGDFFDNLDGSFLKDIIWFGAKKW